ncbi:60s acidic ribosomal P1 [Micractinium conductrix]|uniref:60s acidic ribosomal P1 n=1 Tax=Micractinium conductrix TaxID=554055 RepID=A0A2P6VJE0_9CHLO|nr:60s acidic ribosomal P1 [Micractinium conductrix]|eukprot:PSC74194.1 60s acidic ribosomal P1 [Micractinium conductrix]
MSKSELACVYAVLALHDDGVEITAENIAALTKAAGIEVEPYWPGLFAKLVEKKSVDDFIVNVGAGGGAPAAAAGPAASGAAAAAAEKVEEKVEEEEDEDMGFSLFD